MSAPQSDSFDDLRNLYQKAILDHGRNPRNGMRLKDFDATAKGDNPMCGDRVQVWIKLKADTVCNVGFEARGCAISIASADLMAATVQGLIKSDTQALFDAFSEMAQNGTCAACNETLVEPIKRLAPLASVHEYPSRVKCATLPWHALIAALDGAKEASSE